MIVSNTTRLLTIVCGAIMICLCSFASEAQDKNHLPRVGTIKDYPATGLATGCGNLYFTRASRSPTANDSYIFLARGDGSDAWMNLAGRDVRLKQIKSHRKNREFSYRLGDIQITVVIAPFKPANALAAEGDSMFRMKIILRRGRAVRVVRAIGDADC